MGPEHLPKPSTTAPSSTRLVPESGSWWDYVDSRKLPAAAIDVCAALLVDACGNATSIAFDSPEDHSPESTREPF